MDARGGDHHALNGSAQPHAAEPKKIVCVFHQGTLKKMNECAPLEREGSHCCSIIERDDESVTLR